MTDQIKRFSMTWKMDDDDFVFVQPIEDHKGRWVSHEDYARLKTEFERFRASSFVTAVPVEQYERLRKAGDAMQKRLIFLHDRWDSDEPNIESEAWNAAKEGKPSV